ncbi:MAG: radical SAM protein [Clostridia bacterium]|jgi:MoaA/NifB/PqqE/SkfB family radical SAM enzyme|nr:radical SAM protein [Clostridia bacterium]
MSGIKESFSAFAFEEVMKLLAKDPEQNIPKLISWLEKVPTTKAYRVGLKNFKEQSNDPDFNWLKYTKKILTELHPNVRKKFLYNFFVQATFLGRPKAYKSQDKYDCNVPWAILMDPTTACNLRCIGCWAGEYEKTNALSFEELDNIIQQGKELGIYMYLYSGGEPLMRKDDLIRLAEKHADCAFLSFTNGTLFDKDFIKEVVRVGNLVFAISIEGFEAFTDMRRGAGTYQRVIAGMDLLREAGVGFGYSVCYHSRNTEDVSSDEFVDYMIEKGARFAWYFTYVPIGKNSVIDLLATPQQRAYMYHRIREIRAAKPLFALDFWNDGEYTDGCIAGGRNYFHINAHGDIEPCAFIHYSNLNIRECTLLEALKSPLFQQYRKNQPFHHNLLRPCPLMDNPGRLKEMVHLSKAHSTQGVDRETVEELTDKMQYHSRLWAKEADKIWEDKCKHA